MSARPTRYYPYLRFRVSDVLVGLPDLFRTFFFSRRLGSRLLLDTRFYDDTAIGLSGIVCSGPHDRLRLYRTGITSGVAISST